MATPTTEEEYNYITRGYATQVAEGLDMKKGYHFIELANTKVNNYTFTTKVLMRDAADEVAGVLVVVYSEVWKKTYYLCIPHGNNALAERYFSDLNAWDKPITQAYCQLMSVGFGGAIASMHQMEKKLKN